MIWFTGRPAHVHYETVKHAMLAVLTDDNGYVDLRLNDRYWLKNLTPAEMAIYRQIRRAFYRGQDRVVTNLNTGRVLILTPIRYVK